MSIKKKHLIVILAMALALYRCRKPLKYELMYRVGVPEFTLERDDELRE